MLLNDANLPIFAPRDRSPPDALGRAPSEREHRCRGSLSRPSDIGLRLDRARHLLDLVLQTLLTCCRWASISRRSGCFERFATAGRLVVEEDAVTREDIVRLTVVDR